MATAKNKVGDNPINTTHVDDLLANKQFRSGLGLKGNEGVARSAQELIELAKTVGFEDDVGKFHPANSISAWDAVRKSLTKNISPETNPCGVLVVKVTYPFDALATCRTELLVSVTR